MKKNALKAAFPHTIPVMTGYLFLGMAYGIYMNASGFSVWYPLLTSIVVFGGSLEFMIVSFLLSPFAPLQVFVMAFLLQARHLFYGLSMLDKYKETGLKKLYLIFALSDETFSINYAANIPEGVDKGWFYFFCSILDQSYWIVGTTTGALLGSLLHIQTEGISFVMTAMFVVIFLEQWLKEKNHVSSCLGLLLSVICLILFGSENFMIPTMITILVFLTLLRRPLEGKEEAS